MDTLSVQRQNKMGYAIKELGRPSKGFRFGVSGGMLADYVGFLEEKLINLF